MGEEEVEVYESKWKMFWNRLDSRRKTNEEYSTYRLDGSLWLESRLLRCPYIGCNKSEL